MRFQIELTASELCSLMRIVENDIDLSEMDMPNYKSESEMQHYLNRACLYNKISLSKENPVRETKR